MRLSIDNFTTINPLCESNNTVNSYLCDGTYVMNCVVTVISSFSGLPLNIYAVWLILRGAGSQIGPEFFTLNLALTDIIFFASFLAMPFIIFSLQPVVKALDFFHGFLITGRALFQSCICVERYLAVIHPVLFLKCKPLRYRLVCSGIVWLITMSSCVVLLLIDEITEIFWFAVYVTFFGVMLFCCLAVLRALCKPGPGKGEREGGRDNQVKMKAFKIILLIVILQLITIITIIVAYYAQLYFEPIKREITKSLVFLLIMSTCLIQPLLYLHRARKLPSIITL